MIKQNQKVFSILGTGSAVAELAQKLVEYEMGDVVLYVGENLSYPDEKIFQANASELTSYEGQALSVVFKRAIAIPRRCRIPKEKFRTLFFPVSFNPTISNVLFITVLSGMPR